VAANQSQASGRGFARVAKRISAWTTCCLLTVMILVAGVGFGRQVRRWWAGEPAAPQVASQAGVESNPTRDPRQFHVLEFGDQPWSVGRQTVQGDQKAAVAALRAKCRELIGQPAAPANSPPPPPSLLAALAKQSPMDEEPGKWKLYELREDLPMVVGTHETGGAASRRTEFIPFSQSTQRNEFRSTDTPSPVGRRKAGPPLAKTTPSVVIWGLGVPAAPGNWTIYTFQPSGAAAGSTTEDIPLPPGSSRILCARAVGGLTITAFAGSQSPETWKHFYDRWAAQRSRAAAEGWQHHGANWHARYLGPDVTADIHFGPDGRGGLRGVVVVGPANR
jgi:hypothetical protein